MPLHDRKHPPGANADCVHGFVLPGYELVRDVFRGHFTQDLEDCAQCCVYVRGRKVVDLWGERPTSASLPTSRPTSAPITTSILTPTSTPTSQTVSVSSNTYTSQSLQCVFSSSKVLTSLVVAMLVDRGHLQYEERVCTYWPEYAACGKDTTTVVSLYTSLFVQVQSRHWKIPN